MRRLTHHDDRGVAALIVVLTVPVLILCGAFVFDGGRGILARRQTQNAADAGALAKATDCVKAISTTNFTAYQTNGASLANTPACGTSSTTVSMKKTITAMFPLGVGPWTVTRSATASWGSIGAATTVPITISNCEFSQALLDGTTDIILYLDDAKPQSGCSSLPGGFGQLLNVNCAVTVSASGTVAGDPGGDIMKQIPCITNPTAPVLPHDILVPMYNAAACSDACKGHGPYPILGFAMFHVTGYSFNGNKFAGSLGNKCPDQNTRGKYCIQGDFIRFVTSQGSPGPSTDFGTSQVYLSS
jgi:Putative Flp pilus-assembly TadE/G-like